MNNKKHFSYWLSFNVGMQQARFVYKAGGPDAGGETAQAGQETKHEPTIEEIRRAGDDPEALANALQAAKNQAREAVKNAGVDAVKKGRNQVESILNSLPGINEKTRAEILHDFSNEFDMDKNGGNAQTKEQQELNEDQAETILENSQDFYEDKVTAEYDKKIADNEQAIDTKNDQIDKKDEEIDTAEDAVEKSQDALSDAKTNATSLAGNYGLNMDYDTLASADDETLKTQLKEAAKASLEADAGATFEDVTPETKQKMIDEIVTTRLVKLKTEVAKVQAAENTLRQKQNDLVKLKSEKTSLDTELSQLEQDENNLKEEKTETLDQIEAGTYVIPDGKYQGKTLSQAAQEEATETVSSDEVKAHLAAEAKVMEEMNDHFNEVATKIFEQWGKETENRISGVKVRIDQRITVLEANAEEKRGAFNKYRKEMRLEGILPDSSENQVKKAIADGIDMTQVRIAAATQGNGDPEAIKAKIIDNTYADFKKYGDDLIAAENALNSDPELVASRAEQARLEDLLKIIEAAKERFE